MTETAETLMPEEAHNSKPDVRAIMADIRARVKTELERAPQNKRAFKASSADSNAHATRRAGELLHSEELRYLNTNYSYSTTLNFESLTSHRPGLLGKIIVKIKRKVLRVLWDSLLKDYFSSEREYQAQLVRFLNDMSKYVDARDASNFWELIKKIDYDVTKALERIERIADEQSAALRASERHTFDELNATLRELALLVGEAQSKLAYQHDRMNTLESVSRGLESILARYSKSSANDQSGTVSPSMPDMSYMLLENRFRGSEHEIAARLSIYPSLFSKQVLPVLEMGVGRGELLELMQKSGVRAYGVDIDKAMVDATVAKGFDARFENGISHLRDLPDRSLGGLIAIQVVEHLPHAVLRELCELAAKKVASGGKVVFETINPQSLTALSSNYFRDPTHQWPLHPDTLGFCMSMSGLEIEEVRLLSPIPEEAQLREIAVQDYMSPRWLETIESINRNMQQLNHLLYGYQDYCVIARVP